LHPLGCALHAPVTPVAPAPPAPPAPTPLHHPAPHATFPATRMSSISTCWPRPLGSSTCSIKYVARNSQLLGFYGKILHGDLSFWVLALSRHLPGHQGLKWVESWVGRGAWGVAGGHAPSFGHCCCRFVAADTDIIVWNRVVLLPRRGLPLNYFSAIFASNLSEMLFRHCGFVCLYIFMCALRSLNLHIFSYCDALFFIFRMASHIVISAASLCIVIIWSGFIWLSCWKRLKLYKVG